MPAAMRVRLDYSDLRLSAPPWRKCGHRVPLAGLVALGAALTQSGCASSVEVVPAKVSQNGVYQLNAEELALDCRKLTGRMQIRILQVRSYSEKQATSLVSKGLQSSIVPVFGGTSQGSNPDAQYATDRAQLEAYNKQLVAKGCKSYDLDAALATSDVRITPVPTIPKPKV